MRIFLTGASGFIGSAVVRELIDAGHQVLGLARSDAAAEALANLGAERIGANCRTLRALPRSRECEGAIHAAFIHDWANYEAAAETDRRAIETLGAALAGTNRPLVVTAGTLYVQRQGALATEQDRPNPAFPASRRTRGLGRIPRGACIGAPTASLGPRRRRSRLRAATSKSLAKREFRRTSAKGSTAGPPSTGSMRPTSRPGAGERLRGSELSRRG